MTSRARIALLMAAGGYVLLIHCVLVVLVFKTDFLFLAGKTLGWVPPKEWNEPLMLHIIAQAEPDTKVPSGATILVGDSIIEQLDAQDFSANTVNFGIGGDTTRTLYGRLPMLRSLVQSAAVVVGVGVNDLKYRPIEQIAQDYNAVLDRLASSARVEVLSVLPVDEAGFAPRSRPYLRNRSIDALNQLLRVQCQKHANCQFIDAWPVMTGAEHTATTTSLYGSDGWHLSAEGNQVLADLIRRSLGSAPATH